MTGDNAKIREAQVARSPSKPAHSARRRAFPKLRLAPRKKTTLVIDSRTMPLSSIVSAVSKNSTNAGTMAVVPLVLASVGITSYARYASAHAPAESKTSSHELEHEREEHLHQHIALAWKGTR